MLLLTASFLITYILTPGFSRLALQKNIIDRPGSHKTHQFAKPLLGGLAIFFGVLFPMVSALSLSDKMVSILLAAFILVITGFLDDLHNLNPWIKLSGQTLAASIVVLNNVSYFSIFINTMAKYNIPQFLVLLFLIGWIILMINAINLIDGIDGLAAGTAAIIFIAIAFMIIFKGGSSNILGLAIICTGACLGFIPHNFNPARVFMGDTGSMLLGFLLATTFLLSFSEPYSVSTALGSVFIFAFPLMDVHFAIYRRLVNRKSIFSGDKGHIHHILLAKGYSVNKTVILIYLVNICFAAMAVVLLSMNLSSANLILIGMVTAVIFNCGFRFLSGICRQNGFLPDRRKEVEQRQTI
jgi:UDP-GlcNAc:undecaprenyl-phosphate/decaprenyl-phosphate GlcNAc-1-phosphate transferase